MLNAHSSLSARLVRHIAATLLAAALCVPYAGDARAETSAARHPQILPPAFGQPLGYEDVSKIVASHDFTPALGPEFESDWSDVSRAPRDAAAWSKLGRLAKTRYEDIRYDRPESIISQPEFDQINPISVLQYDCDRMTVQLAPSSAAWSELASAITQLPSGFPDVPQDGFKTALHQALTLNADNVPAYDTGFAYYIFGRGASDLPGLIRLTNAAISRPAVAPAVAGTILAIAAFNLQPGDEQRRLDAAARRASLKLTPSYAAYSDGEENLGNYYRDNLQWMKAQPHFAAACAAMPNNAFYRTVEADNLFLIGQLGNALAQDKAAVADDPHFLRGLEAVAARETSMGDNAASNQVCKAVIAYDPGAEAAYNLMTFNYPALHDPIALKAALLKTVALNSLIETSDLSHAQDTLNSSDFQKSVSDAQTHTPLMNAAQQGDLAQIQTLAAQGADVNAVSADHITAIWEAATHNQPEIVDFLASHGAKLDGSYDDGSLIAAAVIAGDQPMALRLLALGAPVGMVNSNGRTALVLAAEHGDDQLIEALLAKGAKLSARDPGGWDGLLCAAYRDRASTVKLFISCGADINDRINTGTSAAMFAVERDDLPLLEYLVEHGALLTFTDLSNRETFISKAAENDDADMIRYLSAHGEPITVQDATGSNALMFAARMGQREMCQYLIAHGADINHVNANGDTALTIAHKLNHPGVEDVLYEAGEQK